jgi:ketosteroid isomerase-like protein
MFMQNRNFVIGIFITTALLVIAACTSQSPQLTTEQQAAEEKAVWTIIGNFLASIENESWQEFKAVITENCIVYGTDISNVDQGYAELEPHMQKSFDMIENTKFSNLQDKSIKLHHDLAAAMFNATWNTTMGGQEVSMPTRWAFTLEKQNGAWLISQCTVSVPTVGEK